MASALATRYSEVTLGDKTFPYDAAQSVLSEEGEAKKKFTINQSIAQKVWEGESSGIIKYEGKSYFIHPKSGHPTEIGVSLDTTSSRVSKVKRLVFRSNYSHTISVSSLKAQGVEISEQERRDLDNDWMVTLCEKCTRELKTLIKLVVI